MDDQTMFTDKRPPQIPSQDQQIDDARADAETVPVDPGNKLKSKHNNCIAALLQVWTSQTG